MSYLKLKKKYFQCGPNFISNLSRFESTLAVSLGHQPLENRQRVLDQTPLQISHQSVGGHFHSDGVRFEGPPRVFLVVLRNRLAPPLLFIYDKIPI